MVRVDASPRHKNRGRPKEKSAPAYLAWLRKRNCHAKGHGVCFGKIEAAHTYGAGDRGMSTKCSDSYAIPLCSRHHSIQHNRGWKTFEREYGFEDPAPRVAEELWRLWPGRFKWEQANGK